MLLSSTIELASATKAMFSTEHLVGMHDQWPATTTVVACVSFLHPLHPHSATYLTHYQSVGKRELHSPSPLTPPSCLLCTLSYPTCRTVPYLLQTFKDTRMHRPEDTLTAALWDASKSSLVLAGSTLGVWKNKGAIQSSKRSHEAPVTAALYNKYFHQVLHRARARLSSDSNRSPGDRYLHEVCMHSGGLIRSHVP